MPTWMAAVRSLSRGCLQLSTSAHAPAARAFLQLAARRSLHTSPPLLDFLAPNVRLQSSRHGPKRSSPSGAISRHGSSRTFTSTSSRKATAAILNPRKDDDGNDMGVEITPRASNRLKEIMTKDANPNLALRITVESGGCHGFQYLMSLTTLPPLEGEEASVEKATRAAEIDAEDTVFQATDGSNAKVVMDLPSLELLKGSKIDYTMELIGSQFKIVDNPLATSSCGCGTSFDIKA